MEDHDTHSHVAALTQRVSAAHEKIEAQRDWMRTELIRMETDYRREVDRVIADVRSLKSTIIRYAIGIMVTVLVGVGSFWLSRVVVG